MSYNTRALTWRELIENLNGICEEMLDKPVIVRNVMDDIAYEIARNSGIVSSTPYYDGEPNYEEASMEYKFMTREV